MNAQPPDQDETDPTLPGNTDQWANLRDKNDNVPVQTTPSYVVKPSSEKVCRTCLELIDADSYVTFENVENLLNMCLPKLDLMLIKDPVVCQKCFTKLEDFHAFANACMKIEKQLEAFCIQSQAVSPIDVWEYLKHSLKQSSNFDSVKQEEFKFENRISNQNDDDLDATEDVIEHVDVKSEQTDSFEEPNCIKKTHRMKIALTKRQNIRVTRRTIDPLQDQVKCELCNQKFTSKWALDRHTPFHKPRQAHFKCESCNMVFRYKHSYNKHLNAHIAGAPPSKPFACECGKFFNRMSKLKKHQEIHVKKDRPFACPNCGKRFSEQQLLDAHIERVHISEKAFSCELCGNKYTSKAGLDVHLKSHFPGDKPRPEPDLMCDICGKLFYRKYSLEKHHMSHTGDKPHECDQCQMKFKERYQLTIHMRRHTGEKPFQCEVCNFKFPSKNRLGVHMRVHTGVRPFPCQLCEMAFSRNDHLIKHVRAKHTGERPFVCEICSKTFNRKDYLLKHMKIHAKKEFPG